MAINFEKALCYFFIAFVVLAPLPFGGNIPVAWALNAFVAGVLAVWMFASGIMTGRAQTVLMKLMALPIVLFASVCIWAWLQSSSQSPSWLHHPLWGMASEVLGEKLPGAISVNPYETRIALMRLLTYGVVFWLAFQLGRDSARAKLILKSIAVAVGAYALYGLFLWSAGSKMVLWYELGAGGLSSTFVNRNNFATYAGLGAVAFLGLIVHELDEKGVFERGLQLTERFENLISSFSGATGFYIFGLFFTLSALILTNSRAGFAATMVAMVVVVGFSASRKRTHLVGVSAMSLCVVAALFFLLGSGGEQLAIDFSHFNEGLEDRGLLYLTLVEAIKDTPFIGSGYGTFEDIYPMYRDESMSSWGTWDMAHSTYLEVMMDLGLPAAFSLFIAIGCCVWMCLRGTLSRNQDRHIPLIGLAGSVLVAIHSTVDFSLQMSGIAITYAALLGLGCAQSWSSRHLLT